MAGRIKRDKEKLKVYRIYLNGKFVSSAFGDSSSQALAMFCKEYRIDLTSKSRKFGNCGALFSKCTECGNGRYMCGSSTKCKGYMQMVTRNGTITVVEFE